MMSGVSRASMRPISSFSASFFRFSRPISIMSGIKTAVVMTVGTATLAAFIGGGGYGSLIVRGLALDDTATILAGAAPAAAMALAFHALFELLDRLVIPRGLR